MISIGITGSTGILGKNLIYFLKKNKKFKINQFLDDISNNKKINNWINKNQFDIIVHLAAIVPTKKVNKNYKEAKKINVDGTKNLINSIKKYQISKPFYFFLQVHTFIHFQEKLFQNRI